jgi:antitoxin (DNA-binding transcriptional repressor) of toxin-antitoxin stability system
MVDAARSRHIAINRLQTNLPQVLADVEEGGQEVVITREGKGIPAEEVFREKGL